MQDAENFLFLHFFTDVAVHLNDLAVPNFPPSDSIREFPHWPRYFPPLEKPSVTRTSQFAEVLAHRWLGDSELACHLDLA